MCVRHYTLVQSLGYTLEGFVHQTQQTEERKVHLNEIQQKLTVALITFNIFLFVILTAIRVIMDQNSYRGMLMTENDWMLLTVYV